MKYLYAVLAFYALILHVVYLYGSAINRINLTHPERLMYRMISGVYFLGFVFCAWKI